MGLVGDIFWITYAYNIIIEMTGSKRFITGFLALAFLAGSLALVFSSLSSKNAGRKVVYKEEPSAIEGAGAKSVFVEAVPKAGKNSSKSLNLAGQDKEIELNFSDNFTDNLGMILAVENINGEIGLPFGEEQKADLLAKLLELDLEISFKDVPREDIRVIPGLEEQVVNNYATEVENVFRNLRSNSLAEGWLVSEEGVLNALNLSFEQALLKAKAVRAPEPLIDFHLSLVNLLNHQLEVSQILKDYQVDPLKAVAALESYEQILNKDLVNLELEIKKLEKNESLSFGNEGPSLFASIIGVKKAHAFIGLTDLLSIAKKAYGAAKDTKDWISKQYDIVKEQFDKLGLTKVLKNQLVKAIINETLNWIRGGGKPKFVTDPKSFLANELDAIAGNEIYKHMSGLCEPIRPWVGIALDTSSIYEIGGGLKIERTRCTLSQVRDNLVNFYEQFENGGWAGFFEVIQPQNNYFGSLVTLHDGILQRSDAQKEATQLKLQTSNGYLTTKVCARPRILDVIVPANFVGPLLPGQHYENEAGPFNLEADAKDIARASGFDYIGPVNADGEFEACPPDGWEDTTPGQMVAEAGNRAIGADLDLIVNAEDLSDLGITFASLLLGKIFSSGDKGITGGAHVQAATTDTSYCANVYDINSPEYSDCIAITGEISSAQEVKEERGLSLPTSTLITLTSNYIYMFSEIKRLNEEIIYEVQDKSPRSVLELVSDIINECPRYDRADATAAYSDLVAVILPTNFKIFEASSSLNWLANFDQKLQATTSTEDLASLTNEIQLQFNAESVSIDLEDARNKLNEISAIEQRFLFVWNSSPLHGAPQGTINRCDYSYYCPNQLNPNQICGGP